MLSRLDVRPTVVDTPLNDEMPPVAVQAGLADIFVPIDLGFLPGGLTGIASAINDSGWIAGVSSSLGGDHVFLYKNGVMLDYGDIPNGLGSLSVADLNNRGVIVGSGIQRGSNVERAFYSTPQGRLVLIPAPHRFDGYTTVAAGINDSNVVAGTIYSPDFTVAHAIVWSRSLGFRDIHPVGPYTHSFAYSISAANQLAGNVYVSSPSIAQHAFMWPAIAPAGIDLSATGGTSAAAAINASGVIVGIDANPVPTTAMQWTAQTGIVRLPWGSSTAAAVSELGRIVGHSTLTGTTAASTSLGTGPPIALPLLPTWRYSNAAWAVNRCGDIVGYAVAVTGENRPALWRHSPCD
ncbi:MAG: hypothetical protein U0132_08810 [Gemmatimonadaceae bacterium]